MVYVLHGLPASSTSYLNVTWVAQAVEQTRRQAIVVVPQGATAGLSDHEYPDWGRGRTGRPRSRQSSRSTSMRTTGRSRTAPGARSSGTRPAGTARRSSASTIPPSTPSSNRGAATSAPPIPRAKRRSTSARRRTTTTRACTSWSCACLRSSGGIDLPRPLCREERSHVRRRQRAPRPRADLGPRVVRVRAVRGRTHDCPLADACRAVAEARARPSTRARVARAARRWCPPRMHSCPAGSASRARIAARRRRNTSSTTGRRRARSRPRAPDARTR